MGDIDTLLYLYGSCFKFDKLTLNALNLMQASYSSINACSLSKTNSSVLTTHAFADISHHIHSNSQSLCALFLSLESQTAVVPLLLFHAELPFLCYFHVVVLEPEEILSVAPVRWQHLGTDQRLLSEGNVAVDIPVFLVADAKASEPASTYLAYLRFHVLDLFQVSDLSCILSVKEFACCSWIDNGLAVIDDSSEIIFATALSLFPEARFFVC